MNDKIVNNLYELWKHVGNITNTLHESENYSCVSVPHSDWPNRIFDLNNSSKCDEVALEISLTSDAPKLLTVSTPNSLRQNSLFEFVFGQQNMALDLKSFISGVSSCYEMTAVTTKQDSIDFSEVSSRAFGYRVDSEVILKIAQKSSVAHLFVYKEGDVCLACGMVFFDSHNIAGLHMIGTLPTGRGRGIGKCMTERLLLEAQKQNASLCVLHASKLGEPIYRKLGFEVYGGIETYRLL